LCETTVKAIGILGGMGPMATVDLMEKIIRLTPAGTDQEHIPILVDCNTQIPDRTAALLSGGPSPLPQMVRSALRLQMMGAQVLAISCNTAHCFYDRLVPYVDRPALHMIRETAAQARRQGIQKVGLLATDGTIRTGIYGEHFTRQGIQVVLPDREGQRQVMSLIYQGVKAGDRNYDTAPFLDALERLARQGAETFVLGCTELPLAFAQYQIPFAALDPTEVLARSAIRAVGREPLPGVLT